MPLSQGSPNCSSFVLPRLSSVQAGISTIHSTPVEAICPLGMCPHENFPIHIWTIKTYCHSLADGDSQESQWLLGWLTLHSGGEKSKKWVVHNHPTLASTFQCPRSSHQATWDYSVERFPRHICTTNGRLAPTDGQPKQHL